MSGKEETTANLYDGSSVVAGRRYSPSLLGAETKWQSYMKRKQQFVKRQARWINITCAGNPRSENKCIGSVPGGVWGTDC